MRAYGGLLCCEGGMSMGTVGAFLSPTAELSGAVARGAEPGGLGVHVSRWGWSRQSCVLRGH